MDEVTYKSSYISRKEEKKNEKWKAFRTAETKNTNVEQEESTDNKIDKWRNNEYKNKNGILKIRWTSYKDVYLKAMISNIHKI